MVMRTARERAVQTLSYEIGGLVLAAPLYALVFGRSTGEGAVLIAAMAVAVLLWSPLHNALFDRVEWRSTGRVASDRPHRWRIVHALSHEASSVIVTVPVILLLTEHGIVAALLVDLGLTLFYTGYAYLFYLAYDRLRPVKVAVVRGEG